MEISSRALVQLNPEPFAAQLSGLTSAVKFMQRHQHWSWLLAHEPEQRRREPEAQGGSSLSWRSSTARCPLEHPRASAAGRAPLSSSSSSSSSSHADAKRPRSSPYGKPDASLTASAGGRNMRPYHKRHWLPAWAGMVSACGTARRSLPPTFLGLMYWSTPSPNMKTRWSLGTSTATRSPPRSWISNLPAAAPGGAKSPCSSTSSAGVKAMQSPWSV
mmetsp:Transcript_2793/g.8403  ORF Transcript_2793/g.8403 Transcript_2793/m.8403 type:complete len:217 (-) Transcript_2793:151-801(-)